MIQHKFRPWQLLRLTVPTSTRRRVVEAVCYPFTSDAGVEVLRVRMVPGLAVTVREVPMVDLSLLERKARWVHVAQVSGVGGFPEDMLRYDAAALVDPDQHEAPEDPETGRLLFRPTEPVQVYCVSDQKLPSWTLGRWASFGWECEHLSTLDLREDNS